MSLVGLVYLPVSQVVQILTPPTDTDPAAHNSQVFVVDDAYLPAEQYVHFEDPANATFPASQSAQLSAAVPEYFPTLQIMHEAANDAPLYLPEEQLWQEEAPAVEA